MTRPPPRGADQVEGRVLRVDRDGLVVERGGRRRPARPGGLAEPSYGVPTMRSQ